jgi:MFS family permease
VSYGLLWSNRNYRLLLSGSAVTNLGDGAVAVAMPWLATLLTRDPLMISVVAMAEYLPWLLFALPAGVWTDRADRRLLIIRADSVRLALALCLVAMTLSIPAASAIGGDRTGLVAMLAAIAFLLGTAAVVRGNAAQTLLPSIVGRDSRNFVLPHCRCDRKSDDTTNGNLLLNICFQRRNNAIEFVL